MMIKKMVYVIVDLCGNFISTKRLNEEGHFTVFTGRTDGFTFYEDKKIADKKLEYLNNFGDGFRLLYIDLWSIPVGCIKHISQNKKYIEANKYISARN